MEWYIIVLGVIIGSVVLALIFLLGFACGVRVKTNAIEDTKEIKEELNAYIDAYQNQGIKYRRLINDVYTEEAIQKLEKAIEIIKEAQKVEEDGLENGQLDETNIAVEGTDGSRMEQ